MTKVGTSDRHDVAGREWAGPCVAAALVHPGQQRDDRRQEQVARQLGHGRDAQHDVVGVDLPVGERRAHDLRGVVHGGAEEQPDGRRPGQERMRQVGIDEHAEQPEGDDVGDGVGHLPFVGVDGRGGRDDGGDAADARARGDERSQTRRQTEPSVEPGHEQQAGGDGRQHDRHPGQAQTCHLDHAQLDAHEHDAEAEDGGRAELQPGAEAPGQRHQVAEEQADHDRHRNAGDRAGAGEPAGGQQRPAEHVGELESGEHDRGRGQHAREHRQQPRHASSHAPPTIIAAADDV